MCTYIVIAAVCYYLNMPTSTCGDCISWGGYELQRCPIQLSPVLRGDIDKLWTRIVTTRTWGIYARILCPSTRLCTGTFHTLKEWRSAGRGSGFLTQRETNHSSWNGILVTNTLLTAPAAKITNHAIRIRASDLFGNIPLTCRVVDTVFQFPGMNWSAYSNELFSFYLPDSPSTK